MLNTQKQYASYLHEAAGVLVNTPVESTEVVALEEVVQRAELLVPVIGAFSAGKSSMLNAFLGRSVLPVDIKPETDLATELRYGTDERLEAVTDAGEVFRFELAQMDAIKPRASEFSHLRLFLDCLRLREIAPLVLVDMPGFDSALAIHNKAIARYIGRGAHYVVLTSVEEGNITKSMQRQLVEIRSAGQSFSFFISKANLRSADEVADVVAAVRDQVAVLFDEAAPVVPIGDENADGLKRRLAEIDPEGLFKQIFGHLLKAQHLKLVDNLNLAVAALENEAGENKAAIEELQQSVQQIVARRDELLAEARQRYSGTGIERSVQAVGQALSSALDELVGYALAGNQDDLGKAVSDISRGVLVREVKKHMQGVGESVAEELSLKVKDLNKVMSGFALGDRWVEDFTDRAKLGVDKLGGSLRALSDHMSSKTDAGKIYKAVSTVLAVTTSVVAPALELLIIFLPEVLGFLAEHRRREDARTKILTQVIPEVKRNLGDTLPRVFDKQIEALVREISEGFERDIREKQETLSKVESEKQQQIESVSARATALREAIAQLRALATEKLYAETQIGEAA